MNLSSTRKDGRRKIRRRRTPAGTAVSRKLDSMFHRLGLTNAPLELPVRVVILHHRVTDKNLLRHGKSTDERAYTEKKAKRTGRA